MRSFSAVVEETCALFSSLRIRYVIVGGVAASALGRVRSTLDVDVIVDLPEERIPDVVRAFTGRGFRTSREDIADALRERVHFSIIDTQSSFHLDCKGAYGEAERRSLEGRRRRRIGRRYGYLDAPENLIVMKLVFGSERDIADAEAVYVRQRRRLNLRRASAAAAAMGVRREWDALRARLDPILRREQRRK